MMRHPEGAVRARASLVLWVVQATLRLTFVGTAVFEVLTPRERTSMITWAGEVAPGLFYLTAAVDLLGGLGLVVPGMLGRARVAAVAALMAGVIVFHLSRGEASATRTTWRCSRSRCGSPGRGGG